ncbi:RHS repeat-associated core domain-containing protein [Streptacidiphilus sp. N1-3]|uniref:RHS repeat-associated core domain-containing protein n=1 Tax=Streptacidiphilus alkalitolerans TaxID=3342712 RepID=A0ABV6WU97_9ACTN
MTDFGSKAAVSPDLAVNAFGDGAGYHIQVAQEKTGFTWKEVAVLRPGNLDDSSWTGYQCTSGDGRYEAVAVLPTSAVNNNAARDQGAFAYSVDLRTGTVRPIASGVGLEYFSPGCGTGDQAAFSLYLGTDEKTSEILTADLTSGKVVHTTTVAGQVTSTVPTGQGLVGVMGSQLVSLPRSGAVTGRPSRIASVAGSAYELRPAADGGIDFLTLAPGRKTASVVHESHGTVRSLGTGPAAGLQIFQGRAGHNTLAGSTSLAGGSSLRKVDASPLADPAYASLDGDAVFGDHQKNTTADSSVLVTGSRKLVKRAPAAATTVGRVSTTVPPAVPAASGAPAAKDSAYTAAAAGSVVNAAFVTPKAVQATALATVQTPKCSVPRNDPTKQAMQPSNAQVDWAVQMAEQNLLTGSAVARPANFDNLGLASYSANGDFAQVPLSHPASSSQTSVPRSVMEAILAQESNWDQASWHALPGIGGNPLIGNYYGTAGSIDSINYAAADCGYGIGQVTNGMASTDTTFSAHGQIKVAVDYEENIAAGLQILERSWNQLYAAGITANGGDPKYLENWYFAIWAYNSGVQPTAAYGNTTNCTPGPTCAGPDGTWGLGWSNNPANPNYPPNRQPYLAYTYGDAAHPGSWPYQERVLGWMGTPLLRSNAKAYAGPAYHGGSNWLNIAPFTTFCGTNNHCTPNAAQTAGTCGLADSECWWSLPASWIPSIATTGSTSSYTYGAGSTEPSVADPHPPTCNRDSGVLPSTSSGAPIIVSAQVGLAVGSTPLNIAGCSGENWSNNGTFTMSYGTDSSGNATGAIDTHQLGVGFGGYTLFTHTHDGSESAVINTGTWTPNLPKLQYYKIKLHFPATAASATNAVYSINPGGGVSPWKIRVNQDWGSEQWVTIGTFAMENGGNVVLTNQSGNVPKAGEAWSDFDVAYDAIAFTPEGGTPGQPIGGPPTIQDAPKGSNPAYIQCGCARRTAGDPVDTSTGYFGQDFTDLTTPGRGAVLNMTRSYAEAIADPNGPNGSLAADGPLGWGWTFNYNQHATTDATTGNVTVRQEDGSSVTFLDASGTYTPSAPRFDATLTKSGSTYTYTRLGQAIFSFDVATGHLLSEQDLAGSKASTPYATVLAYDSSGHLSTVTDPAGRTFTFTWTGSHITKLADSAGRTLTYAYDANDNLTDVVDAGGGHSQYGYDGNHLMVSMRTPGNYGGPASAVTSMVYDSSERVTTQKDPDGDPTTFAYNPDGTVLVTDPAGHQIQYTYQNGLLTKQTNGYGTSSAGTWSYTYDPVTLGVTSETDPAGHLTTYTYDDHGNKSSESNSLGYATDYQYDDHGNLIETIGPDGVAKVNQYDQSGHIPSGSAGVLDLTSTTVTSAENVVDATAGTFGSVAARTVNYYYDDPAHPADLTRTVDALGNTTTDGYDAFGDKTSVTDAVGNKTTYSFDTGKGWLMSSTTPQGDKTTYTRDAWGQLTKSTDALGHTNASSYDLDGHAVSSTDGNGRTSTVTYDAAGRPTQAETADGTVTKTDYNPDGTVADTVDGLGNRTSYGYDGQGRKVSRTDPDLRTTSTVIDPSGRVTSSTDAKGRTTTMGYDAAGELLSVAYSDTSSPGTTFSYDPAGRKTSMTDGTGTTSYTYDAFGELTQKITGAGAVVAYGFDNGGNLVSMTYPGETTAVARGFDADNRLASITDTSGKKTAFGYSADGVLASTTYPDGDVVTNGYDTTDTLTSAAVSGSTSSALTLGRDNAGQVDAEQLGTAPSTSFSYTDREQLAAATGGSPEAFAIDRANNPTTVGGSTQSFDAAGQLCWSTQGAVADPACATAPTGARTFSYDQLGERTAQSSGAATYGYDQSGRLTSFSGGGTTAAYTYDGVGARTSKTVNGATTSFVYDDSSLSNLLTDGTNDYLYGPGGLPIEQKSASASYWFVHDQVGSTTALLDASGAEASTYAYSAYGVTTHSGTASTPLQYTGQYTDAESGLLFLRARYYDPSTAEFLTVDPDVDLTGTPYAYAGGNPLNAVDLSGLDWWNPISWSSDTWKNIGAGALAGAAVVGTAACIVAEPCGVGELAIAGGASFAAGGISISTAASWGAAAGAFGGLAYSVSSGGDSSSGDSGGSSGSSSSSGSDANRQASQDYAHQQAQMDHVFVAKHKLGALIASCGDEGATMDQIIDSVQDAPDGIYGKTNPLVRVINGYTVTIRGAMIKGVFKVGTAFIP